MQVSDPGYCGANRRLAESIGAFHAFLAPAARYGWIVDLLQEETYAERFVRSTKTECLIE